MLSDVKYVASWSISSLPIVSRENRPLGNYDDSLIDFVKDQLSGGKDLAENAKAENTKLAPLVLAYYAGQPLNEEELSKQVVSYLESPNLWWHRQEKNAKAMLLGMGAIGEEKLSKYLKKQESERKSLETKTQKVKVERRDE